MSPSPLLFYAALGLTAFALFSRRRSRSKSRLPPGPPQHFIFGNALQMPSDREWLTFTDWAKAYGDVIYVNVLGRKIIILNTPKAAMDLLDKRSSIYSDRPHLPMAGDLVGWDRGFALLRYGQKFRDYRRIAHSSLSARASTKYWSLQEREAALFLQQLLIAPDQFVEHIRHTAGMTALKIAYGFDGKPDDPLIDLARRAVDSFSLASAPGAFLVDFLPILKYVPAWMPGAQFKRTAAKWKQEVDELFESPYEMVKQRMAAGTAVSSLTFDALESQEVTPEREEVIKGAAGSLYGGGADTTVSAISSFFLAMTLFPDIQKKAQAEVDSVLAGQDRLPGMADRSSLPYVDCIVKEVLRWNPVAPLGVPHRLIQDDTYEGYLIPSGSIVISNIWAMLHDEKVYPNPFSFEPERFLDKSSEVLDPHTLAFGFGRRICPGLHVADVSLYLAIATTLATMNISKTLDENGREIEPDVNYLTGTISHPTPFQCDIKPRSEEAARLIQRVAQAS